MKYIVIENGIVLLHSLGTDILKLVGLLITIRSEGDVLISLFTTELL